MKLVNVLLTILFVLSQLTAVAQDCGDLLYEANQMYEAGELEEVAEFIEGCPKLGLSKAERFEAYKLLAITYHELDKVEESGKAMEQMLRDKPNYQNIPNGDPTQFIRAVAKYNVSPSSFVGFKFGPTFTSVNVTEVYTDLPYDQNYNSHAGYQLGLVYERVLANKLSAEFGASFNGTSISKQTSVEDKWNQQHFENIRFFQTTLGIKKYFGLMPGTDFYIVANGGLAFLSFANMTVAFENEIEGNLNTSAKDVLEERNKMQSLVGLGLGISQQIPKGQLSVELNYSLFLSTYGNVDKRMNDLDFIFNHQHISDDLKLRTALVNVSWKLPLTYLVSK